MENSQSSQSNSSEQSSEVSSSQNDNKCQSQASDSTDVRIAPAESSDAVQQNLENASREAKAASTSCPAPSRLGFSLRSSLLGRSTFSAQPDSSPTKPFTLNPPKLIEVSNPFSRISEEVEKDNNEDVPQKNDSPKKESSNNSSEAKALSFVPLAGSASSRPGTSFPTTFGAAPPTTSFVFGQNLREKVETPQPSDEVSSSNGSVQPSSNGTQSSTSSTSSSLGRLSGNTEDAPKANGTTSAEMLFTSAVKGEVTPETTAASPECDGAAGGAKSLSEAAKEYEESRQVKRKFEAVPLITGEENEFNVLQMNCKLLAYDKGSLGWQERGRGTLRLNDSPIRSRLIVRAAGSLRLLLNTQIWGGMCVQRANQKSVRFTAVDSNGEMRIFVVMATVKEIDQLERCLEARVKLAPELAKKKARMESAR